MNNLCCQSPRSTLFLTVSYLVLCKLVWLMELLGDSPCLHLPVPIEKHWGIMYGSTGITHRSTGVMHRSTRIMHRKTKTMHGSTGIMHGSTESMHGITESMHGSTEITDMPCCCVWLLVGF